ncbi:MAG: site-specific integrase [Sulfuritalea sp.]|nr:site-specific integrase [Sulfuritalea sp.]MDP1984648.1 site-specific integrase [Sulfuritalea sp.]
MASITQRETGKWQAKIRRPGYPTETRSFTQERAAQAWARAREAEMDRGIYLPRAASEKTTISDLLDRWKVAELPGRRAKTHFLACINSIRESLALGRGTRALATITSADAAALRDELLAADLSPSTVRKVLFFAATVIDWGIENHGIVLAANPFRLVKRPPEPKHRDRRLVGDEEKRLFEAAAATKQHVQLIALLRVGIETGARLGELLALEWHDADLKRGVMTLRGREVDGKRQLKNSDDLRHVPLSPVAVAAFQTLPRPIAGGRVFTAWRASDSFSKQMQRVVAAADMADFKFHDLRHEFASRMAPRVQMQVLMKLLGHKSTAMVSRYYNQTIDDVAQLARTLYS